MMRPRRGRTIPLLRSPERRRAGVAAARGRLGVSERRACRVLDRHRSVQRHAAKPRPEEERLTAEIVELASLHGRYG
jgi:putative transposase